MVTGRIIGRAIGRLATMGAIAGASVTAAPMIRAKLEAYRRARRAQIVLMVGPKGSGKTTLGNTLAEGSAIQFVAVEAIAKRVLADHGGTIDEHYASRAFDAIAAELECLESSARVLIIETTGASEHTTAFLARLRRRYEVVLVRVRAPVDLCRERIASRDPGQQIDVPEQMIRDMHSKTEALDWPWDVTVDNGAAATVTEIVERIRPHLRKP